MQEGFSNEIQRILLLAIIFSIIGLINNHFYLSLLVGLTGYLLYSLRNVQKLYRWLAGNNNEMPPEMSGVLGGILDEIYRLKRRVEQSKKNYTSLALRIRQITSAIDDGIILLNADRSLDWWNASARTLLSLKDTDSNEIISNLIRNPRFVTFIHGDNFDKAIELPCPQDPSRIYHFMAGTFGKGEVILTVRDITRLRHLEDMRKEFVANISHELRTPLTVLTGYIETLQSDDDHNPAIWQKALVQMDQQTRRLNALTEDLVMLSRLESSPAEAHHQTVELQPLLNSIIESTNVVATANHRIRLHCPPKVALPSTQRELHSAFSNLVFNAIKHNPGGCNIDIKVSENTDSITVNIADNGMGIDSKHLPRLTERFYRVDDSRTTASGGTGLGLAIVKHVLARHHGKLIIDSTLGQGSTFSCIFKKSR